MFKTLTWERNHPWMLGAVAILIASVLAHMDVSLPKDSSFFSAVITLGGIFSAFSVTIKSLILSNKEKMKSLRESGYCDVFMKYLAASIDGSLMLCMVGLLGFFDYLSSMTYFTPVVIGLFIYSMFALRRVTMASTAVLRKTERRRAG